MDTSEAKLCWLIRTKPTRPKGIRQLKSGMVGIASGQTARINVVNTAEPDALAKSAWVLGFTNPRSELIAESTFTLESGESAFLNLPFEKCGAPGETRHQIRVVVTVLDDPTCACIATLEVFDNQTGRTAAFMQVPELG